MSRVDVAAAMLLGILAAPPRSASADVKFLPDDVRVSFKDSSSFQLRASVTAIPDSVRAAFAKARGEASFLMAEPGAEWQATDVVVKPKLPHRRLKAVALSQELCILFYEVGGRGHSDHVVVFRHSNDSAQLVWRAVSEPAVTSPMAILVAIEEDRVDDDPKNGF